MLFVLSYTWASSAVYVDYIEIKAVGYTPVAAEDSIENATLDVDYNNGTVTVTPDDENAYPYNVTATVTYLDNNEPITLERIDDTTFKFDVTEFEDARFNSVVFNADLCTHNYDDAADSECNTCGKSRDTRVLYPAQTFDVVVSLKEAISATKLDLNFDYNAAPFSSVSAKWNIDGRNISFNNKVASIEVSEEYTVEEVKTEKIPQYDEDGNLIEA